jgi:hypothetical protein
LGDAPRITLIHLCVKPRLHLEAAVRSWVKTPTGTVAFRGGMARQLSTQIAGGVADAYIKLIYPSPHLHLLRFSRILASRETMLLTDPNQALRTPAIGLSTISVVLGLVLIIGVTVAGPA